MTRLSRRQLLVGSGGLMTALAGCTNRGMSPGDSATTTDTALSTHVSGTNLVVTVPSTKEQRHLSLIAPDGTAVETAPIAPGATRVSVPLGGQYAPGDYTLTTTDGHQRSVTLRPDLTIEGFTVGQQALDRLPESLGHTARTEAIVTITNTGTGPTTIAGLRVTGDVPAPTEPLTIPEATGVYGTVADGEHDGVVVEPDATTEVITNSLPFLFAGQAASCVSMPATGTIEIEVTAAAGDTTTTATAPVQYEGQSDEQCRITSGSVD